MARSAGLAMSWDEWSKHDATGLAALVRKRAVTPREVVRQAARAVELVNPRLAGVLEVYEDVLDRPGVDGPARDGALYGVPLFLKDLGSGLRGPASGIGEQALPGTRHAGDGSHGRRTTWPRASSRSAAPPRPSSA